MIALFILFLASCACADDPGMRLFLSPQKLPHSIQNSAAKLFDALVSFAIYENCTTPFYSPNHTILMKGLNVSSLYLSTGGLALSTQGLEFYTHDLGGNISFSLMYGAKNTTLEGVAHFTMGTFSVTFLVKEAGGHPLIHIPSVVINVQPKNIEFNDKVPASVRKEILATFSTFIKTNVTNVAMTKLPLILQAAIGYEFGSGTASIPLGNLTINVGYKLTSDPVFTDEQIILDILGDITVEGDSAPPCPLTSSNIPSNYTGPNVIAVGIDAAVVECVFWEGKDPRVVEGLLKAILPVFFDKRVSVLAEVLGTPSLDFTNPDKLEQTVALGLYVPFARADLGVTFISFNTSISVGLDLGLNMSASTADIIITNITLSSLELQELNAKYVSPTFLQQVKSENWESFRDTLNTRLSKAMPIKSSLPVPAGLTSRIRNLTFKTGTKYALVSFDLE